MVNKTKNVIFTPTMPAWSIQLNYKQMLSNTNTKQYYTKQCCNVLQDTVTSKEIWKGKYTENWFLELPWPMACS